MTEMARCSSADVTMSETASADNLPRIERVFCIKEEAIDVDATEIFPLSSREQPEFNLEEEAMLEDENSTKTSSRQQSCAICRRSFNNQTDIFVERHYCHHFADQLLEGQSCDLSCRLCGKKFQRRDQLVVHLGQGENLAHHMGGPGHGLLQQLMDRLLPGLMGQSNWGEEQAGRMDSSTGEEDPLGDLTTVEAARVDEVAPIRLIAKSIMPVAHGMLASIERPRRFAPRSLTFDSKFDSRLKSAVNMPKETSPERHHYPAPAYLVTTPTVAAMLNRENVSCFQCGFVVVRKGRYNLRRLMYSHYVRHYRPSIAPYMTQADLQQGLVCTLCGQKHAKRSVMERHVAIAHRVLDNLLPAQARFLPASFKRKRMTPRLLLQQQTYSQQTPGCEDEKESYQPACPLPGCRWLVQRCSIPEQSGCLKRQEYLRWHSLRLHLLTHYRPQLLAFVINSFCQLCGAQQRSADDDKSWEPLFHVGVVHNQLKDLLPADVAALVVYKPAALNRKAARRMAASLAKQSQRESESLEEKMQPEEHAITKQKQLEDYSGINSIMKGTPSYDRVDAGATGADRLLRCPLPDCHKWLTREHLTYHLACHYQAQLRLYTRRCSCMICGLDLSRLNVLTHVGVFHNILETLIPPHVAPLIARYAVKSVRRKVRAATSGLRHVVQKRPESHLNEGMSLQQTGIYQNKDSGLKQNSSGLNNNRDSHAIDRRHRNHRDSKLIDSTISIDMDAKQTSNLDLINNQLISNHLRCPLSDCARLLWCPQQNRKGRQRRLRTHLMTHYRGRLMAFTKQEGRTSWGCRICGREMTEVNRLLVHVATVHDVLKEMVPARMVAVIGSGSDSEKGGCVELGVISPFVEVEGVDGLEDEKAKREKEVEWESSPEAEQFFVKEEVVEEECKFEADCVKKEFARVADTVGGSSLESMLSTELSIPMVGINQAAGGTWRALVKEEMQEEEEVIDVICAQDEFSPASKAVGVNNLVSTIPVSKELTSLNQGWNHVPAAARSQQASEKLAQKGKNECKSYNSNKKLRVNQVTTMDDNLESEMSSTNLSCPLLGCNQVLAAVGVGKRWKPLTWQNRRLLLIRHLVVHYRAQLNCYVEKSRCSICGRAKGSLTTVGLLVHLAKIHKVLDELVPPRVLALIAKKPPRSMPPNDAINLLAEHEVEREKLRQQQFEERDIVIKEGAGEPACYPETQGYAEQEEIGEVDAKAAEEDSSRLACPLDGCHLVLADERLDESRERTILCQHLALHYRLQLDKFVEGDQCSFCRCRRPTRFELLAHVGMVHDVLERLVPSWLLPRITRRDRGRKRKAIMVLGACEDGDDGNVQEEEAEKSIDQEKQEFTAFGNREEAVGWLLCPLRGCGMVLSRKPIEKCQHRAYIGKHLTFHYWKQLEEYVSDGCCSLCGIGKRLKLDALIWHVALVHDVLEGLVPPRIAPLIRRCPVRTHGSAKLASPGLASKQEELESKVIVLVREQEEQGLGSGEVNARREDYQSILEKQQTRDDQAMA